MRRLWARRRDAVDRRGRVATGSAGSASPRTQLAHSERLDRIARDVARGRLRARAPARHGRLEPLPGGARAHLRPRATAIPELHVLDSTDPAQVKRASSARSTSPRTLFIVSSKSGTTLEPNIFERVLLRARVGRGRRRRGGRSASSRSPTRARSSSSSPSATGFRHVAHGVASIGGRYSALSDFGMVPGAVMGVDVHALLDRAERMAHSCAACVPAARQPGARARRDHRRLRAPRARQAHARDVARDRATSAPGSSSCSPSRPARTGKGVIPVDREPLGAPDVYGDDRLFVYVRLGVEPRRGAGPRRSTRSSAAGHPVVRIELDDLVRPRRRVLPVGVRDRGRRLRDRHQPVRPAGRRGVQGRDARADERVRADAARCRRETPIATVDGVSLYRGRAQRLELRRGRRGDARAGMLRAHLGRIGRGDYVALLAYVEMTPRARAGADRDPPARSGIARARPPASASGRASCTPPGRRTRAGPNSRRLPPDHLRRRPRPAGARAQVHASASSRPPRRAATSRSWPSAAGARFESTSATDVDAGLAAIREAVERALLSR